MTILYLSYTTDPSDEHYAFGMEEVLGFRALRVPNNYKSRSNFRGALNTRNLHLEFPAFAVVREFSRGTVLIRARDEIGYGYVPNPNNHLSVAGPAAGLQNSTLPGNVALRTGGVRRERTLGVPGVQSRLDPPNVDGVNQLSRKAQERHDRFEKEVGPIEPLRKVISVLCEASERFDPSEIHLENEKLFSLRWWDNLQKLIKKSSTLDGWQELLGKLEEYVSRKDGYYDVVRLVQIMAGSYYTFRRAWERNADAGHIAMPDNFDETFYAAVGELTSGLGEKRVDGWLRIQAYMEPHYWDALSRGRAGVIQELDLDHSANWLMQRLGLGGGIDLIHDAFTQVFWNDLVGVMTGEIETDIQDAKLRFWRNFESLVGAWEWVSAIRADTDRVAAEMAYAGVSTFVRSLLHDLTILRLHGDEDVLEQLGGDLAGGVRPYARDLVRVNDILHPIETDVQLFSQRRVAESFLERHGIDLHAALEVLLEHGPEEWRPLLHFGNPLVFRDSFWKKIRNAMDPKTFNAPGTLALQRGYMDLSIDSERSATSLNAILVRLTTFWRKAQFLNQEYVAKSGDIGQKAIQRLVLDCFTEVCSGVRRGLESEVVLFQLEGRMARTAPSFVGRVELDEFFERDTVLKRAMDHSGVVRRLNLSLSELGEYQGSWLNRLFYEEALKGVSVWLGEGEDVGFGVTKEKWARRLYGRDLFQYRFDDWYKLSQILGRLYAEEIAKLPR